MPRHAADLEVALNKKGGLTLSQLANYDDLITDALVDRVYFWTKIRKLKANYHPSRGVQEETVCAILRESVVWEKDAQAAHQRLMNLPGIAKYSRSLRSEDEKEHFERHLRKYINIYLPDCSFEVATTNRYTVHTAEACVKARKNIRRGEVIKYLTGIQVEMTEKEEEELSSRTDFSIVLSSRRKRPSLFLGPARFANHDCDSNARLNTSGPHGIHIVAVKEIMVGDEINVTYGGDYFGIDNQECLCSTCESLRRNGWDPKGPWLKDDSSDEEESEGEEEEEKEEDEGARHPAALRERQPSPGSEIVVLGKRKRGEDTPRSQPNEQEEVAAPKRKRGRSPKHTRIVSKRSESANSQNEGTHVKDEEYPQCRPRRSLSGKGVIRETHSNGAMSQESAPTAGTPQHEADLSPGSMSAQEDSTLDKIFRVLDAVADRLPAQKGEQTNISLESRAIADRYESIFDMLAASERGVPPSRRSAMPAATGLLTPPYARGLSRSPERSTSKRGPPPPTPNSIAASSKLRLPTMKKKGSISSLRNVMNATSHEDAGDVYSIPASPDPAELQKRKRGRPRKNPAPKEKVEDATDSSVSPSSHIAGNDTQASADAVSTTSVETFAAGNISSSICQMLTTDAEAAHAEIEEQDEDDEPVEVAPPDPRITRRQAQAAAAQAEEAARAEKQAAKEERGRSRGPLRKSPRKAPPSISRPAVQSIETPEPSTSNEDEDEEDGEGHHRGPTRKPSDYHLTPILLPTLNHRWIECRNCDEFFIQAEAHLTRIACPRCERHSKLYGYYWPKTDKEGKGDVEERVKDHRTIHRLIDPKDERVERKGRRALAEVVRVRVGSGRLSSSPCGEGEAEEQGRRLRRSPGGRRRLRMTM